jgi:hypothetical protein
MTKQDIFFAAIYRIVDAGSFDLFFKCANPLPNVAPIVPRMYGTSCPAAQSPTKRRGTPPLLKKQVLFK